VWSGLGRTLSPLVRASAPVSHDRPSSAASFASAIVPHEPATAAARQQSPPRMRGCQDGRMVVHLSQVAPSLHAPHLDRIAFNTHILYE
jgi:hypothetical protein